MKRKTIWKNEEAGNKSTEKTKKKKNTKEIKKKKIGKRRSKIEKKISEKTRV